MAFKLFLHRLYVSASFFAVSQAIAHNCSSKSFALPQISGGEVVNLDAVKVNNFTFSNGSFSFCNVSLTYTHPGASDLVNVWVWLPDAWNGRFQGVGGGGFITGLQVPDMSNGASRGYASVSTDGGHDGNASLASWGLLSEGNINWELLQDFAARSLNDMTGLGKQVTEAYYGINISYSYWSGCSTGGRQGMMMAQRYPEAYDGIMANAPAVYWDELLPALYWPQFVMNQIGYHPGKCETDAIAAYAIEACDALDGLKDGIISLPGQCHFSASSVVGRNYTCQGQERHITSTAAQVMDLTYHGPHYQDGRFQWYGLFPGSDFSALGNVTCSGNGSTCVGNPFQPPVDWLRVFVLRDPNYNLTNMNHTRWDRIFKISSQQFSGIIDTSDADLSMFRSQGRKMITWHGLADQAVFFNTTTHYYHEVERLDPEHDVTDYYRVFSAPGVQHCGNGLGQVPDDPLAALVAWVEEGKAPDLLSASTLRDGNRWTRDLCLFPKVSIYTSGDPTSVSSYDCR